MTPAALLASLFICIVYKLSCQLTLIHHRQCFLEKQAHGHQDVGLNPHLIFISEALSSAEATLQQICSYINKEQEWVNM